MIGLGFNLMQLAVRQNNLFVQPANPIIEILAKYGGGSATGGTLYDLMHVKTAGATGQAATVGDESENQLGVPSGTIGAYKFSNPGNSSATCIFAMWWEELPIK